MNNITRPKFDLILIDGSSYLHRAFHALPNLTNSRGEPTGAIYGFVSMLRKLLNDFSYKYVAVVFDTPSKNFRHTMYPDYKAHRPPTPTELQAQIAPLHSLIDAMGIKYIALPNVEADDVIATLTKKAENTNLKTLIASSDKDLAQLVNNNTNIIDSMSNIFLDSAGVEKKFGLSPNKIIDYLSLIGDASDNIPGIPGVGPKTAIKWLVTYGSLAAVIEHANDIPGSAGKKLRTNIANLALAKQLITLKTDINLALELQDLIPKSTDQTQLKDKFLQLEFKKFAEELVIAAPLNTINPTINKKENVYKYIITQQEFATIIGTLNTAPSFAIEIIATNPDPIQAEIIGIAFAFEPYQAFYIPLKHSYIGVPNQLNIQDVISNLRPILENPQKIKLGYNLKYILEILANYDINMQSTGYDIMLESYVLNNNTRNDLNSLALEYLGINAPKIELILGSGKKQLTFDQIDVEIVTGYAAFNVDITLQLHAKLWPQIIANTTLNKIFTDIEMPLVEVLAHMERNGVCLDKQLLQGHSKELTIRIQNLEQQIYTLAGTVFNANSPKQLQEILFSKLKLPIIRSTPNGQPSTAEDTLQELAIVYPLPKIILEYRSLSKLKTTYVDTLPNQIKSKTNRVHTSYNQAITATGRLSSTNPNLQNIPTRTQEGQRIRAAFIVPVGKKMVSLDYSQIELRIMAHLSNDANLCNAFAKGDDVHQATAAEIFAVKLDQVTDEQRRRAKTINFGLIYGMSAFGLAQQLGISREQAQNYINIYFQRYPGIKSYMDTIWQKTKQTGYAETLFGRRIYIQNMTSSNQQLRKAAERVAINAPIQGTAADIIKIAMINIDKWIQKNSFDVKMLMQVHDELVFEISENELKETVTIIQNIMTQIPNLSIPLIVNIGIGLNWNNMNEY